jgi:hypothetical protein
VDPEPPNSLLRLPTGARPPRAVKIALHTSEQMVARVAGAAQISHGPVDDTTPVLEALPAAPRLARSS